MVAFRLATTDTLADGSGLDLLDDFRAYTALVGDALKEAGIVLGATTADSVVVELEAGPRRVIMLAGLDYPFGYVLVEPGYAETILTGVSTDEELMAEVDWYFGSDEAERSAAPRSGWRGCDRIASRTRWASTPGVNGFCRKPCWAAGSRAAGWRRRCSPRCTGS